MEGKYGHENPLQLMSSAFGGTSNDASDSYQGNPNHKYVTADGKNHIPPVPFPLSQWIHCQETSPGSVEFITERSVTEISREMSYHNAIVPSGGMDVWKVGGDAVLQEVKYARPQNWPPMNSFTDAEYQLHAQGQESNELHSRASVAAPAFLAKPHNHASRRRASVTATATDRARRMRITERHHALNKLLPRHKEGSKASQLDDITDYIKYLQLQIKVCFHYNVVAYHHLKDLSRSRLGGEPTTDPFVFLEGYGHYILHEQMLNEPLEEMMGKLLEVNPSAASRLLESRGLVIMPTNLVEGLHQAM
ncbi:hypothetical protein RHGRI_002965 [Rhododendron griersonianum]|uniref:BHLH domain-containing protein n=1 Tax=Rhododendron griersonianum TaxID=479676 RepID=A0AAV6LTS7_9ERIC|nr:hypothetical protein RHGRI_002965 [Rhododendron griersonianum]